MPSDVIIDASMPCVVRDGSAMWNKSGKHEKESVQGHPPLVEL